MTNPVTTADLNLLVKNVAITAATAERSKFDDSIPWREAEQDAEDAVEQFEEALDLFTTQLIERATANHERHAA